MSFELYEESVESGEPVELYHFGYQSTNLYYTSAADDFIYDSNTYVQVAGLSRSQLDETGEISKSGLEITAPEDFVVSKLFEVYPPSDIVDLTITRVHRGDVLDGKVFWIGRILNVAWSVGFSTLTCESLFTRLRLPGLRRVYGRNCPHVLYGPDCRAQASLFVVPANLNGLASGGFSVSSPTFDTFVDGYFTGGKLDFEISGGVFERRGIRDHIGPDILLSHPITGLLATSAVEVYPGCDRTKPTCITKFDNLPNYGGFPYMKEKNPFAVSVF